MNAAAFQMSKLAENLARGYRLAETSMGLKKDQNIREAKGWKEMVEDITDPLKRCIAASMLENYRHMSATMNRMNETTTAIQVGNWDKFAYPMISLVSENLVAQDLVSVQPLDGPTGLIFFTNYVTGQTKGNRARGSTVWDALTGHADSHLDSSDRVTEESLGVCDSGGEITVTLAYVPVIPGSVSISTSGATVRDDANGNIISSGGSTVGSIDYNTGAVVTTTANLGTSLATVASYNYNAEINNEAQQVDFEIQSRPITAQERKLRARWSQEAAFALESLHSVKADPMISTAVANHLKWEIDREIIEELRVKAGAGAAGWSASIPSGSTISYTEHKLSFVDAMTAASSFIQRGTNRAKANWAIFGTQGSNVVETLPQFEPSGDSAECEGVEEVGKLGRMKIYSDPRFPIDEGLLGYKGKDLMRAGFVFAPWILLYTTPNVQLDDFLTRKGFMSSYGKTMVNNKMYARIKITDASAQF